MKLIKYSLYLFCLILIFPRIEAATPEFKVLAANGKISYKKDNKGSWKQILSGLELFENDMIKLGSDCYLGLVHKSGKTEELTKQGTYKVSQLSKEVSGRKSSMVKRFTDYVVDEMGDVDDMLTSGDYHDQMETTGAVERAVEIDFSEKDKLKDIAKTSAAEEEGVDFISSLMGYVKEEYIVPRLPRNSYVLDTKLDFSWYKKTGFDEYEFSIRDNTGKTLLTMVTTDTIATVDLKSINAVPGNNYFWRVSSGDAESMECCFSIKDKNAPSFADEYKAVSRAGATTRGALELLVLASFYEEYNIMNRAAECYRKAMEAAPGVEEYKKMYAAYLNRIGLVSESRALVR